MTTTTDAYLIGNGTVITLGEQNRVIDNGAICIKGGKIEEVGETAALQRKHGAPIKIDARGKVVLPGFICAHHHLYSTMARGFAPPGEPAFTFQEILERLWWKLDRALSTEDVRLSALIPLVECIRNGTTTILDHHASPSCRDGSLGVIADAAGPADVLAARRTYPNDKYLLQEKVVPEVRAGRRSWFRGFYVLGEVHLTWWDDLTHVYAELGYDEAARSGLVPVYGIVRDIARVSKLRFFSTEVARDVRGRLLVVDYVNEICDMRLRSGHPDGVPDAVVGRIAGRIAAHAAGAAPPLRPPEEV